MKTIYILISTCSLVMWNCSKGETKEVQPQAEIEMLDNPETESEPDPEPEEEFTWKTLPVPADAGEGMKWEFQELSDDFEYEAPADVKGDSFLAKWDDFYHNAWAGPGLTEWRRDHTFVSDGNLQLISSRKAGTNQIHMGCITSKTRVIYPVYIEARAKVMNSTLASDVWLLSPDDTQEIDIVEAYGANFSESANSEHSWYAERIHISHHVFIRDPFADYQPKDAGSWYHDGTIWNEDFHTFGVYWKDPWHLEYYIDGQLVRTVSGKEIIDPLYYTNATDQGNTDVDTRTGLSKEMDIIINAEDQTWRSTPASGLQEDTYTPTDAELANTDDHTFKVDWIRIFKPVVD